MKCSNINQLKDAWGYGLLLLQRIYRPILNDHQVTPAEKRILYGLSKHEQLSKQELAKVVVLEPSAITRAMQRLEQQGDIKRYVDPQDRRSIQLMLTVKGRKKINAIGLAATKIFKRACVNMTDEQISQLTETLSAISDNLMTILETEQ